MQIQAKINPKKILAEKELVQPEFWLKMCEFQPNSVKKYFPFLGRKIFGKKWPQGKGVETIF